MLDELVNATRVATEDAWDELRQERVLQRVLDPPPAPKSEPVTRSRWPWALAAAMVVVAAAWILWPSTRLSGGTPPGVASLSPAPPQPQPATSPTPVTPAPSRIQLADGSVAALQGPARLVAHRDEPLAIEIEQLEGEILFTVPEVATRQFELRARHVRLSTRAATFEVRVAGDAVGVTVVSGKVVLDAHQRIVLRPGEQVELRAAQQAAMAEPAPQPAPRPRPTAEAPSRGPSAKELMARADAARGSGDNAEAADALRALTRRFPKDRRVPSAWFTLARVEAARGRTRAAAKAYEAAFRAKPRGPLAEDSLGEAALAWARAGEQASAARVARRYLARFPTGVHSERMRQLVL